MKEKTQTDSQPVKVIFRKWKSNGEIIALFPEIPHDVNGVYSESYQHIGQHGAADPQGVVSIYTNPAIPEEYADLKRELEQIGYVLRVCNRIPCDAYEIRRKAARV